MKILIALGLILIAVIAMAIVVFAVIAEENEWEYKHYDFPEDGEEYE